MAIRMFYSYNIVCSHTMHYATCITTSILSWLFRVAVKVNRDIKDTPGHDIIGGIDMDHAEKVVPDSLYLLI